MTWVSTIDFSGSLSSSRDCSSVCVSISGLLSSSRRRVDRCRFAFGGFTPSSELVRCRRRGFRREASVGLEAAFVENIAAKIRISSISRLVVRGASQQKKDHLVPCDVELSAQQHWAFCFGLFWAQLKLDQLSRTHTSLIG